MPLRKLDLGPADVHVDGAAAAQRAPHGPRCVSCGTGRTWSRDESRACVSCGAPFFESPQDQRPRLPTGTAPPSMEDPGTWVSTRGLSARDRNTTVPKSKTVTAISAAKRKSLPTSQFALPEKRAYPIDTAARVRNAPARLEQAKKAKRVTPAEYARARRAIARAARKFGIKSQYLERDGARPPSATPGIAPGGAAPGGSAPGVRVTVHSHPSGHRRVEVMHARAAGASPSPVLMADRVLFGEQGMAIDLGPLAEEARKLADVEARLAALPEDSEGRPALEADAKKLRDELVAPRWNQVAKVGRFLGHSAGPFELSPATFDEIVRNFKNVDGGEVPIDFEHASEADESSGSIPQKGAPAQGYVLDVQNRAAEGLWGLFRLLEPALTYVREGKYRFVSPAIRFGAKHPETGQPIGARLTSVALVTRPFLRGMQPLAARDPAAPGATTMSLPTTHHELMKTFKAAMKLPDVATHTDMKDHLARLREHAKAILDKPAVHAMGHYSAAGVHVGDYIPPLAEAINAPAHMAIAEILDAVEEMIDAAIERHEAEMHTMSDQIPSTDDPSALAQALGEAKANLRMRDGQVQALTTEKSKLELQLKDAQARIADLEGKHATLEGEVKTMRDTEAKRAEDAVTADVDLAFATYKDTKKLSDTDRKAMTIVRRTDPATFATLYPVVPANKQHLLRDLTTSRAPAGAAPLTAPAGAPGEGSAMTPADQVKLADRLITEKKMSREAATGYAYLVATGQRPMPTFGN